MVAGRVVAILATFAGCVYNIQVSSATECSMNDAECQPPSGWNTHDAEINELIAEIRKEDMGLDAAMATEAYGANGANGEPSNNEEVDLAEANARKAEGPSCSINDGAIGFLRNSSFPSPGAGAPVETMGFLSRFGFFGGNESKEEPFEKLLDENRNSGGVLLVDFFANWCKPCQSMKKVLAVVGNHYKDGKLAICKVDVDEEDGLANEYGIAALPTLVLFKRGEEVRRIKGLVSADHIIKVVDEILDQLS